MSTAILHISFSHAFALANVDLIMVAPCKAFSLLIWSPTDTIRCTMFIDPILIV